MILVLWLIKLCVKVVGWRTTSGERAGRPRTERKTNSKAIEEDLWPLLEEMSEYEDMEEEESQDPAQGVDLQNGRENSNSIPVDEMCGSTPIRVNHESVQNQIPMTIPCLNEMIDRRLHVIKTDLLFTRKAQISRLIQRKKISKKTKSKKRF